MKTMPVTKEEKARMIADAEKDRSEAFLEIHNTYLNELHETKLRFEHILKEIKYLPEID